MPQVVIIDKLIARYFLIFTNLNSIEPEEQWSSLANKTLYAIAGKGSIGTVNFLVQRLIKKFAPPF